MKMEQSVPKRRGIKFRSREITQKKTYNIQNTAKVWNQENKLRCDIKKPIFVIIYITHTHNGNCTSKKKIYWLETKVVASKGQLVRTDWFERIRGWAMYVLGFIVIKSNKKICGTNAGCKSKYWKRSWVIHKLWSINRLTLRSLTLYIYGAPILDVSRSHTTTQHCR